MTMTQDEIPACSPEAVAGRREALRTYRKVYSYWTDLGFGFPFAVAVSTALVGMLYFFGPGEMSLEVALLSFVVGVFGVVVTTFPRNLR